MRPARWRRTGGAIVAGLVGAGLLAIPSASAAPGHPAAACLAGSDGITVVVDFGNLAGGVQIRCVTAPVTSGFDALKKAGFTYAGSQRFPGLLCRIDGKPTDEPCIGAPPGDRYWAYWTASTPGGSWTYSDLGAGNRVPPAGSVEGWAFSDGCTRAPQGPPCPSATTTTRRPATTTTRTPSSGAGGSPGGPAPVPGAATTSTEDAAVAAGDTTTTTADEGTSTTTSAVPEGGAAPEPGEEGDSASAAASRGGGGGGGSPLAAILGIGGAAALALLAFATERRRRTAEEEPA